MMPMPFVHALKYTVLLSSKKVNSTLQNLVEDWRSTVWSMVTEVHMDYGTVEVPCNWPRLPEKQTAKSICNGICQLYYSPIFQLDGPDDH